LLVKLRIKPNYSKKGNLLGFKEIKHKIKKK